MTHYGNSSDSPSAKSIFLAVGGIGGALAIGIAAWMYIAPRYRVYSATMQSRIGASPFWRQRQHWNLPVRLLLQK